MEWKIWNSENKINYLNSLIDKVIEYKNIEDELDSLKKMKYHNFDLFQEGSEVIDRILEAIDNDEQICIYGDYDCDGMLATTILVKAFKMLGKDVGYHIPNRFIDGYGLNETRVQQMADKGYTLIITVDNGIKALDAIDLANELGVDVIVTDHHDIGEELPNAFAFLHTKLSPSYPFKEISGGVVAYKLAEKLLGRHDKYLYCLAAITTISDMMPLVNENRSMVKKAFQLMEENHFPAIDLLLGDKPTYTTTSIGFIIGPKINSFGRLPEKCNPGMVVKYFLIGDMPEAVNSNFVRQFVEKAKEINTARQSLTNQTYSEIKPNLENDKDFVFVYENSIHEGIIGLLAGKITKEYNKVSFVMNYDEESNTYKGSARSLPGFNLHRFLETANEDLHFYGGHALAAGFTVKYDRIPSFYQKINDRIEVTVFESITKECIQIDSDDLSISNIKSLQLLEPFGQLNDEPIFYIENTLINKVTYLSDGKHVKYSCSKNGQNFEALFFNIDSSYQVEEGKVYNLIGNLGVNEFRNMQNIQLILQDIL